MSLPLPIPPLRLFEICDQSWCPPSFREYVQSCLTIFWTLRFPFLQPTSPASLAAHALQSVLGAQKVKDYTFVDFCSGAGGPTPFIEREVNRSYAQSRAEKAQLNGQLQQNGHLEDGDDDEGGIDFILTDIHPHLPAWVHASKLSPNLRYIPTSIDASAAPRNILSLAGTPAYGNTIRRSHNKKVFRLFSLAFHHFPDPLAIKILQNTLDTSDGFAILELQGRDVGNLSIVLMLGPLLWLGSWYWFWGEWAQLFWTYVVPVVPFVVVFDGLVSCLRTRWDGEVMGLVRRTGRRVDGWRFESGEDVHTWPIGTMQYFIGIKEESGRWRDEGGDMSAFKSYT